MKRVNRNEHSLIEWDIFFLLPSLIIGVAVLKLPSQLAGETLYSDGWISIVIAGIFITFITVLGAMVASYFPNQSFLKYSSKLLTKPVAYVLTTFFIILLILGEAVIVRSLADISKEYMLEYSPIEVLALAFLLVVVYAVTGSRTGVFWLNMLFLPIIIICLLIVMSFNIPSIEMANFFPLFKTDFKSYMAGTVHSIGAFGGFAVILFYIQFIHKPKNINKIVIYGMSIPIIVYVIVFIVCIGVFGNTTTSNLIYPTIEIAKKSEFPGDIFQRVESLFFTIWIMAFFNTAAIILDTIIVLLQSLFKNSNKIKIALTLSPIIFFISMLPITFHQINVVVTILDNTFAIVMITTILLLFIIAKIRRVDKHEKT